MAEKILIQFKASGDTKLQSSMLKLAAAQGLLEKNTKEMRLAMTRLTQTFEKTERKARLLNNSFATLRSKMLLFSFAMALGGRQLIMFTEKAAALRSMETAFSNLLGSVSGSESAIRKLQIATDGTVSKFDLFQQANNAMVLGITKNEDEMAKMFDMAQRLGETLGVNTRRAIESLVTGLGRQSRLMLDNIGIVVRTDKAYKNYAAELDKTAQELTDSEKKQAFFNATLLAAEEKLKRVGAETDTPTKAFNRFGASMEDLSTKIGDDLLEAFVPMLNSFSKLADSLANLDFSQLLRHVTALGFALASLSARNQQAIASIFGLRKALKGLTISLGTARKAAKSFMKSFLVFSAIEGVMMGVSKVFSFFGSSIEEVKEKQEELTNTTEKTKHRFGDLQKEVSLAGKDLDKLNAIYDNLSTELNETSNSLKIYQDALSASNSTTFMGGSFEAQQNDAMIEQLNSFVNDLLPKEIEQKRILDNLNKHILDIEAQRLIKGASLKSQLQQEVDLLKLKNKFTGAELAQEEFKIKNKGALSSLSDKEIQDNLDLIAEKEKILENERQLALEIKETTQAKKDAQKAEEELQKQRDKEQQEILNNIQKEKEAKLDLAQSIVASNMTQEESLQNQRDILVDFYLTAELSTEQMNLLGDAILVLEERVKKIPIELGEMEQLFLDVGQAFQNGFEQIINQQLDTGKSKFKDFADVVIKEIQRIIVKMAALKIVQFLGFPVPTFHQGGRVQGFNQGGMVSMPNYHAGGNVDNVPIMAQEGEFVMRRSAVESIGAENLARMNNTGQTGSVNITFTGNVMSQDFIESEAIPAIKKAVRRGADLGIS
jgi:hypothetical protein